MTTSLIKKTVFIDTMIFLHFKSFEEVDWKAIFEADEVALIISPVIFTELDVHKDSHPNIKLRKRAKSITRRLQQLFDTDINAQLRDGVTINYIPSNSDLNFDTYSLNPVRRDDQQLALILNYKQNHVNEVVLLLTNDFNSRQRARLLGIDTVKMPDEYELPDEPDPNEKLIKELQQQILELQSQQPVLSLKFDNGSDRLFINLPQPILLTASEITQRLEQLRNKFPKMGTQRKESTQKRDPNRPKGTIDISEIQRLFIAGVGGYTEARTKGVVA